MAGAGGGPLLYKGPAGPPDLHGLPTNLGELSLRDGGGGGGAPVPQSRLSQWKLPTADKVSGGVSSERIGCYCFYLAGFFAIMIALVNCLYYTRKVK